MLNNSNALQDCSLSNNHALAHLPVWSLTQRQLCDLELILNGGFLPLTGFMNQLDYESVLSSLRLTNKTVWPIPITLDVPQPFADKLCIGEQLILSDPENVPLAILHIESIWEPNKEQEAIQVFNTTDTLHPGVNYLFTKAHNVFIGGKVTALSMPIHYDFQHLRKSPTELKATFKELGWQKIVAFQTRNPMHRAHLELTLHAAKICNANLLIQPVVGMTKPGDVDYFTRVRCYEKIMTHYPKGMAYLSLLPLAMRMAGPREALWHAIIRKNYGCSYFIIGRDHAGPGKNSQGKDFYEPYAAQQLVTEYEKEIDIKLVPFQEMVYVKKTHKYQLINEIDKKDEPLNISGTELRRCLRENLEIPEWFTYPEIISELRKAYPPRSEQGFTLFFTGLSGSGKSTLARGIMAKLMEVGKSQITLLDGDTVRKHLSSELGFSKEHRNLNILRIGYVASEITKHKGVAICAPIAPYEATRQSVREMITEYGGFIEIYLSTPLDICEQRDRKGLYTKARAGLIQGFTGIDDPYEIPRQAEVVIDTSITPFEECITQILNKLQELGYLVSSVC